MQASKLAKRECNCYGRLKIIDDSSLQELLNKLSGHRGINKRPVVPKMKNENFYALGISGGWLDLCEQQLAKISIFTIQYNCCELTNGSLYSDIRIFGRPYQLGEGSCSANFYDFLKPILIKTILYIFILTVLPTGLAPAAHTCFMVLGLIRGSRTLFPVLSGLL